MRRISIAAVCWAIFWPWLVQAFAQLAAEVPKELHGTWNATKAVRDGKPARDVVGHRLSITADRFRIQAKDGKPLFVGTVRADSKAKPAAIDFDHADGARGKELEGHLPAGRRHPDDLRQRVEPGQGAAHGVRGKGRVRGRAHHLQAREAVNRSRSGLTAAEPCRAHTPCQCASD